MGKLTDAFIRNATITNGKSEQEFPDGDNLYLVLTQSGDSLVRSWKFRYRFNGKRPKLGLGSLKDVSLAAAREKAKEYRSMLRGGIDPQAKKAQDKAVELAQSLADEGGPAPTTLRELFERWHNDYVKMHHGDGGERVKSLFEMHILPGGMGELQIQLMRQAHVKAILDRIAAKGLTRTAGVALDSMRQMVAWATPFQWMNLDPTLGLKKKDWKGQSRMVSRYLSDDEIIQLNWRLKKSSLAARWRHAIWFLLSTGTRIEETMLAERRHFNLSRGTWTIPVENQKKVNTEEEQQPFVVHLSAFAKTHLAALMAMPDTEIYVFPARIRTGDTAGVRPANEKTLAKALRNLQGVEVEGRRCSDELLLSGGTWTPHDLRRTMSTLMGELGIASHVIDKCQNHAIEGKVKRTYQRAQMLAWMAAAWDALGEKLQELSDMPDPEPHYIAPPPKAKFLDVTDVEAVKAYEKALKAAPAKKSSRKLASRKARNSHVAG